MLVNKTFGVVRPTRMLATSQVGAATIDTFKPGTGTVRTSAHAGPSPRTPSEITVAGDFDFLAASRTWATDFASMRERRENFRAFNLLERVKCNRPAIVNLAPDDFAGAWASLLEVVRNDKEAREEMAEWIFKLAVSRLEMAGKKHLPATSDRLASWHTALDHAAQAWRLIADHGGSSETSHKHLESLQSALIPLLPSLAWRFDTSPDKTCDLLLEQARLLTMVLVKAGHPTTDLAKAWIVKIAYQAGVTGIAALPWLIRLGQSHQVDEQFVTETVMRQAASTYGWGDLKQQPLERLSTPQLDCLCHCMADSLVTHARDMDSHKITGRFDDEYGPNPGPHCFPLTALNFLPELMTRLKITEENRRTLTIGVEQAAELLREKYGLEPYIAPLRDNHAAWLFAHGISREVRDAEHLESLLRGMIDVDSSTGWPWETSFALRGTTFAALAKAARARGLPDTSVRTGWETAKSLACTRAERITTASAEAQDLAEKELALIASRAKAACDKASNDAQTLRETRQAMMTW